MNLTLIRLCRNTDAVRYLIYQLQKSGRLHGPIGVQECLTAQFGTLPDFFKDEDELRALWIPGTRKTLLEGLAEKGFGGDQLAEMQTITDAQDSDLYDVLAHVSYALSPETREARVARAKAATLQQYSYRQRQFVDFVLAHYVSEGVQELDVDKLTPLLRLRYQNSLADAADDLGRRTAIRAFSSDSRDLCTSNSLAQRAGH